ncbi:putative aconitase family protein [Eutypa lata UCREL1]|uniref:Putative aconitase family protein n=1 Tax=Eutypa lata (strain UCR-EL1) TaxID=1287681 RepID=M7TX63_EUTLA|nr:putative aconitase family protein [Eutypa lata UCREL1]
MASESVATELTKLLFKSRSLQLDPDVNLSDSVHPLVTVQDLATKLHELGHKREGDVLRHVLTIAQESPNHGGLGLNIDSEISDKDISEVLFLVSAWIESLNSADRAHKETPKTIDFRPSGRPPMTLTEKIFALHDVEGHGFVRTGTTIRVAIDWIMASEASWSSMETIYDRIGQPGIFRNDRFWLAGDHVVDPRVNDQPIPSRLIQASNRAKKVFKMTEFQGMNYTIMHTEFFRERAQPGAFIIGSDSHTCSAGANGCLSTGLGAADVTMGLVTGETWFKVPEVVNIRFVGQPGRGIGGKDVILYTLQQLKRNTVAADRVVEYTGPGLSYLSPDARFAIANMTTEFGGITGIFVPDHVTKSFIDSRKSPQHKNSSYYFRPDDDAVYAETHVIDLSKCEPSVAKYPNPDDVVPISEVQDLALDGCFIGACTTAEEDIILGALVLEQGLKNGLRPCPKGKRKVVPGSLPIVDMLRRTGLADVYEQAGFEIGVPSCSYCVGMSADRAGEGEVWLSSQNRNYPNRMGKGN